MMASTPAAKARAAPNDMRVAVLIPTYNEPVEVIAPTVAAACALEPSHQTWVLDDGDRPWVAEMCEAFGARYVSRPPFNRPIATPVALATFRADSTMCRMAPSKSSLPRAIDRWTSMMSARDLGSI